VAADAHETITMDTAKLLFRVSEADDEDPFADIHVEEDEDKLEEMKLSWTTVREALCKSYPHVLL